MLPPSRNSPGHTVLPHGVRRALDAMRVGIERDWSVADLAEVAGVSGRTLQRQFRHFLGQAPHDALRDIRFEEARRELLRGVPDAKVMDVAMRCGFPHCGRFSIEYRRRYGETPSETLKRQTAFSGALASTPSFFVRGRDRPMVALCPIEAGPEHHHFARDMADELAIALMRAGIAITSQARSARYHLAASVRGTGRQTRLTFRLIEAETGSHLWAHRSDRALGDDLAAAELLAARVAAALQPCLRLAEIERVRRLPEAELSPHDLTLRAMPGVLSLDADGNARALDLLERATDRDPSHALATALAAWARVQRVVYHFTVTPQEERARSTDLARKALTLTGDAAVLAILGNALTLLHDLDRAKHVIHKALAADGGSAWAWSRSGWIDVYKGEADAAIERFKIALDLAPQDSFAFNSLVGIGCAHFQEGRYLDAARWQERALLEHPSAIWVHRTLCPAYMLAGAEAEARRSLAALRERYPQLTVWDVQEGLPPLPQSYRDRLVEALLTVGLPA
ncbi:MAG: helix-turn-helix domain-containing protein [Alphaproteobacteria bacterium]|nr:helix-turn-helix domain-containing protein [Alphaproteobacteria bacterium]